MELVEIITTAVISFFSTGVGYLVGSRRNKAEAQKIEIENVKEVISVYMDTINDLKIEVKELKEKLATYQKHIEKLESQLEQFKSQMTPKTRQKKNDVGL